MEAIRAPQDQSFTPNLPLDHQAKHSLYEHIPQREMPRHTGIYARPSPPDENPSSDTPEATVSFDETDPKSGSAKQQRSSLFNWFVNQDGASLPLSMVRLKIAEQMVFKKDDQFYSLIENPEHIHVEEPFAPLDEQKQYRDDIRQYFDFNVEYFPNYETDLRLSRMGKWSLFIDIHDETVEGKFPRDVDLRAYISAFRLTVQQNFLSYILVRRKMQFFSALGFLLPALLLAFWPGSQSFGSTLINSSAISAMSAPVWSLAVGLIWMTGILLWTRFLNRNQRKILAITSQRNAGNLKSKVQRRMTMLLQAFNFSIQNIDQSEYASNSNDREWTENARWWAKLALWMPKRIEYIEKFFQSEMQRIRIYQKKVDIVGDITSFIVPIGVTLVAGAIYQSGWFTHNVLSLGNILLGTSVAMTWVFRSLSLFKGYRVDIKHIRDWIGENDWKRFNELGFDSVISDVIRRDKERIRQEKARGGGIN